MAKRDRFNRALITAMSVLVSICSISSPAMAIDSKLKGIRGSFFDFIDDPWKHVGYEEESARFYPGGLLVLDNGSIKAFGPYEEISPKFPKLEVTNEPGRIIVSGFIDGHVHVGQTRVLGAYGLQLLPWLQEWIFPEEIKYKDPTYARLGITHYMENMLACGTTTVQDYGVSFKSAVDIFFDEASKRNMRIITGVCGLDRNAPAEYLTPPYQFYADSKALIEKYHGKGRNLYSIVPKFAYGDSPELMAMCQKLPSCSSEYLPWAEMTAP